MISTTKQHLALSGKLHFGNVVSNNLELPPPECKHNFENSNYYNFTNCKDSFGDLEVFITHETQIQNNISKIIWKISLLENSISEDKTFKLYNFSKTTVSSSIGS